MKVNTNIVESTQLMKTTFENILNITQIGGAGSSGGTSGSSGDSSGERQILQVQNRLVVAQVLHQAEGAMAHHQTNQNGKENYINYWIDHFIIIQVGIIINNYLTIKYKVEQYSSISKLLDKIYNITNNLSIIIVLDIFIILFLIYMVYKK